MKVARIVAACLILGATLGFVAALLRPKRTRLGYDPAGREYDI